jgi:hypothetical protein
MKNFIQNTYELFFAHISANLVFEFKPTKTQVKQIENFIILLEKEVGKNSFDEEFLFYYIAYLFERKKDLNTRFGKGRVPLNHIIGKKSLDIWVKKPDNWFYWTEKMIKDYGIPIPEFKGSNKPVIDKKTNECEEGLKKFYFGSEELFYQCSNMTTLFNENSEFCKKCKFQNECKSAKKEIYDSKSKVF